jgi:hypothetical protein
MKRLSGFSLGLKLFMMSLFCSLIFSSCTVQQELASGFKKDADSLSYLVLKPNLLQKSSLTVQRLYPQFSQLSPELQDTVWKHQTKLLDVVADSTLMNLYYDELILRLKKSGMRIFTENEIDDFNKVSGTKGVFRIGQLQLEEDKQKINFSEELSGQEELYKDMEIEVLSVNVWFEWFKDQKDSTSSKVLYGEKKISDKVDGRFFSTGDDKNYEFRYKRTDIGAVDVSKLARISADQNAQQLIDFLFTRYVLMSYPESEQYFGFDIDSKMFYLPAENLQLIEIKK